MTALDSMIKKLTPLNVYDLSSSSLIYAELVAFAVGLDFLRDSTDMLLKECFVATAEDFGITERERMWGNIRTDLTLDKRRTMLTRRLSFSPQDFTPEGFNKVLEFMGIEGEIEEQPKALRISLKLTQREYSAALREWIVAQLKGLFPAHLLWDVVFPGFCWSDIDTSGNTFSAIDAKGYLWQKIDYEL